MLKLNPFYLAVSFCGNMIYAFTLMSCKNKQINDHDFNSEIILVINMQPDKENHWQITDILSCASVTLAQRAGKHAATLLWLGPSCLLASIAKCFFRLSIVATLPQRTSDGN